MRDIHKGRCTHRGGVREREREREMKREMEEGARTIAVSTSKLVEGGCDIV